MDRRLRRRYVTLVKEHAHAPQKLASGISALPGVGTAFAQTQAAWRFLNNPRVTLAALIEPLRTAAKLAVSHSASPYALLVHDWCKFDYASHTTKQDQTQITNSECIGYEATASLLVDAARGTPWGLMELQLRCAEGVHSTRSEQIEPPQSHLEQILPTMQAAAQWDIPRKLVHVIDREADSLAHLREWNEADKLFLVRMDHHRRVLYQGQRCLMADVVLALHNAKAFQFTREVEFHGKTARQFVAEVTITLDQPGRKRQGKEGPRKIIPGQPLVLRLIVAQVRDQAGNLLAEWLLGSNVPPEVSTAEIAQWYYWRWRIESFFKLLKNAGQQLEEWRQETAAAITRRVLVASMACLTVWHLQADDTPQATELKSVLIRLSGRQMKRRRPVTAPALLAGLHVLLAMLDLLQNYTPDQLRVLASQALAQLPRLDL